MKNKKPSNNRRQAEDDYEDPNNSLSQITYGKPQYQLSPQKSRDSLYDEERKQIKQAKKEGLDHLYKENYQPAKYGKAVEYRNSRSYMKKLPSGHYVSLFICRKNQICSQTPRNSGILVWELTSTFNSLEEPCGFSLYLRLRLPLLST